MRSKSSFSFLELNNYLPLAFKGSDTRQINKNTKNMMMTFVHVFLVVTLLMISSFTISSPFTRDPDSHSINSMTSLKRRSSKIRKGSSIHIIKPQDCFNVLDSDYVICNESPRPLNLDLMETNHKLIYKRYFIKINDRQFGNMFYSGKNKDIRVSGDSENGKDIRIGSYVKGGLADSGIIYRETKTYFHYFQSIEDFNVSKFNSIFMEEHHDEELDDNSKIKEPIIEESIDDGEDISRVPSIAAPVEYDIGLGKVVESVAEIDPKDQEGKILRRVKGQCLKPLIEEVENDIEEKDVKDVESKDVESNGVESKDVDSNGVESKDVDSNEENFAVVNDEKILNEDPSITDETVIPEPQVSTEDHKSDSQLIPEKIPAQKINQKADKPSSTNNEMTIPLVILVPIVTVVFFSSFSIYLFAKRLSRKRLAKEEAKKSELKFHPNPLFSEPISSTSVSGPATE